MQMMLRKEIAEPDESFCEDNQGGHAETVALPEEVATDTTAALDRTDSVNNQQDVEFHPGASHSAPESADCNGKAHVEDLPPNDKAEKRQDAGGEGDKGLEEPLLPNGHQVSLLIMTDQGSICNNPYPLAVKHLDDIDVTHALIIRLHLSLCIYSRQLHEYFLHVIVAW